VKALKTMQSVFGLIGTITGQNMGEINSKNNENEIQVEHK
jgi:hypothetical protein